MVTLLPVMVFHIFQTSFHGETLAGWNDSGSEEVPGCRAEGRGAPTRLLEEDSGDNAPSCGT